MGDVVRMISHNSYDLVVGVYKQRGDTKVFTTQYIFHITEEDTKKIWGSMEEEEISFFSDYIKSIPAGKEAQLSTKEYRTAILSDIQDKSALMTINPKVDSKKQRRVQCSMKLDKLLASGIQYEVKNIDLKVQSSRRKFSK